MRIEWNYDALAEIRCNAAVAGLLAGLGRKYAVKANHTMPGRTGYRMVPHVGPGKYNRRIVNIYPTTAAAITSNARNNTLASLL